MSSIAVPELIIQGALSFSLFGLWTVLDAAIGDRFNAAGHRITQIAIFAAAGWLTLIVSSQASGILLDPRGAVIGLATAYTGALGGFLTALTCAAARWWIGGPSMFPGLVAIGGDWLAAMAVVFWLWPRLAAREPDDARSWRSNRLTRLALLGVAVSTTQTLPLLLIPATPETPSAFAAFALPFFLIQCLGALLFGSMVDIIERRRALDDMARSRLIKLDAVLRQTIDAFTKFTVHTDPYTAGHEARVTDLCVALARRLDFDAERLRGMELAAKTHDIGQMQVPSEILLRPRRLTPLEYEFVKKHPDVGWEILHSIDFPWRVADIVRQHHENFDGTGYPQGLKGEDILVEARILRVADMLESLCSHRPFRSALPLDEAMETLMAARGAALDPLIVDHCVALVAQGGYCFPSAVGASPVAGD
ncbi:HD domain-containing phosphohydrolase [Azospirillum sp.]|uniref:HD-GYP domain-containing protein n=1 Tax=Azospirillum sp. TaxID=34012 RepID=UPI0026078E2F|nr:HD domain-containing phosphohydrolase [Azospirillum sp.]